MKITEVTYYGGSRKKITRLALTDLFLEVQDIILETRIFLEEERMVNGAAVIRQALDDHFVAKGDWTQLATGGIDWKKRLRYNATLVACLGVEVQVSARSDLVIRDIVHLRNSLQSGDIDTGVIVVPSDALQLFLPDRTPSYRDTIHYIEDEFPEAKTYPLVVIAIEHDGIGPRLPKRHRAS